LRASISADRQNARVPFFVAATAGTTNAGMFDPLEDCNLIAHREGLWLHVDAAWRGAGLMSPRVKDGLAGMRAADSVTIDAHKWFAVPMGAGMFLCRDNELLSDTFHVSTGYMPTTEAAVDPYTHSVQWSRRFIGLKMFLSLACLGWEGYRAHIEHALDMSNELRTLIAGNGDGPLTVICFTGEQHDTDPIAIAEHVVASGNAWISMAQFEGKRVLRACITSHLTRREHLAALITALTNARDDVCVRRM
jgi:glutamate/tyrosine decarboxylase-like PLP-dependent enzyme